MTRAAPSRRTHSPCWGGTARGGTVAELGVWMTLSTYPVHNPHTMLSCLMGVNRTGIEGYLRRSMISGKE
jgi:hypothetical protein